MASIWWNILKCHDGIILSISDSLYKRFRDAEGSGPLQTMTALSAKAKPPPVSVLIFGVGGGSVLVKCVGAAASLDLTHSRGDALRSGTRAHLQHTHTPSLRQRADAECGADAAEVYLLQVRGSGRAASAHRRGSWLGWGRTGPAGRCPAPVRPSSPRTRPSPSGRERKQ